MIKTEWAMCFAANALMWLAIVQLVKAVFG